PRPLPGGGHPGRPGLSAEVAARAGTARPGRTQRVAVRLADGRRGVRREAPLPAANWLCGGAGRWGGGGGRFPAARAAGGGRRRTATSAAAVFSQPGVRRRAARSFRVAQQTGPAAVWQVKVVAVAVGDDRRPRHRLILARNRETGEKKYFLTNAPKRIGVRQ